MIGVFVTVLCLVAASHAAPHGCEMLSKPLEELDIKSMYGQWGMVAASLRDPAATENFKLRESITIYFGNSTYTHIFRTSDGCESHTTNITREGLNFTMSVMSTNITGYFLHAPCPQCGVLSLDIEAPAYQTKSVYLLSRKRELEPSEMEEFKAQMEYMKMPAAFMMDPTKELCPLEPVTDGAAAPPDAPSAAPDAPPAAPPAAPDAAPAAPDAPPSAPDAAPSAPPVEDQNLLSLLSCLAD